MILLCKYALSHIIVKIKNRNIKNPKTFAFHTLSIKFCRVYATQDDITVRTVPI